MDIQHILNQLASKGIIQSNFITCKDLKGGTSSKLWIIYYKDSPRYVIKSNERDIIEEEVKFLNDYQEIDILPHVLYADSYHQYMCYSFIDGDSHYPRKQKATMLKDLVQKLINYYKPPSLNGWGYSNNLTASWQEFLLREVNGAKQILTTLLTEDDFHLIQNLIKSSKRENLALHPFLLHGDCGVHNFLFSEGNLSGVIDPIPLVGPPLYDLVFAFCSSSDDLTMETIEEAVDSLTSWERNDVVLCEEILIGLYIRLARCILHHPNDLSTYVKAWNDWKTIVTNNLTDDI